MVFSKIEKHLLSVEKPGRYVGGEFGIVRKPHSKNSLDIALCFPDLYEIGMSNLALKYLYSYFNSGESVSCERVFAPAPDLEKILRGNDIPLYTLENFRPVQEFDILAFTINYELSATNLLNVLDLGRIPVKRIDRTENDPIVIAGGPAISNPFPFSDFLDFVFIGEAEAEFAALLAGLTELKKKGKPRPELMDMLKKNHSVWYPGKETKTVKSIWSGFPDKPVLEHVIVPNIQVVQDVGSVEIMRGCPNGCRFCHAGFYYRPSRERSAQNIADEVMQLYSECGYREITLSSLSTGDYSGIASLFKQLNSVYSSHHISFSLPSLKINTFTLGIFESLAEVRKSGITFAVETPEPEWQASINKQVSKEKIIEILQNARKYGWKSAKFYFMVGLPQNDTEKETDSIVDFISGIQDSVKIKLHLNIGTFIPKAHTPYQWDRQLNENQALEKIMELKRRLKSPHIKFGYHAPFTSLLEGIISRGDQRVGDIIYRAFKKGARLDAWEEHINRDIWREVISDTEWNPEAEIFCEQPVDKPLAWNSISTGAGTAFLKKEREYSRQHKLTNACSEDCDHNCGICGTANSVQKIETDKINPLKIEFSLPCTELHTRYIFTFSKKGIAKYYSHKNLMTIFERTFQRALLNVRFTEGFNPKPKMEFAMPLALGIESESEFLSIELFHDIDDSDRELIQLINSKLPDDIAILDINKIIPEEGRRLPSLASELVSAHYTLSAPKEITDKLLQVFENTAIDNFEYNVCDGSITVTFSNQLANTSVYKFVDRTCGLDLKTDNNFQVLRTGMSFKNIYSFLYKN